MSVALVRMSPGRSSRRRRRLRLLVATTVVWTVLFGWALVRVRQAAPDPSTAAAAALLPATGGTPWFADEVPAYDPGEAAATPDFSIDTEGALSAEGLSVDEQQASDASAYVAGR
jgi:hypothetical protein